MEELEKRAKEAEKQIDQLTAKISSLETGRYFNMRIFKEKKKALVLGMVGILRKS